MQQFLRGIRSIIFAIIDFFYPVFRPFFSLQTFRYAVIGVFNTVLGLVIYYVCYRFVFLGKNLNLGFYEFKGHVAPLVISNMIIVPLGFLLQKFIVFGDSNLKGRIQFFRYVMVSLLNFCMNYILLKILVEIFKIYPTIAQLLTAAVVVLISYLAQRHYSFKVMPDYIDGDDEHENLADKKAG